MTSTGLTIMCVRQHRWIFLIGFASFAGLSPASAQETESRALARRLAALETQVAAMSQSPVLTSAGWTPVELSGDIEPIDFELPPTPYLETGDRPYAPHPLPVPAVSLASTTPVKYPTVQVNGFFQADALYFDQDEDSRLVNGDVQDGAGFRRFRLSAKGAVADNVNYMGQLDFGFFGRPTFTDVWGEVTDVPVFGNVRFGQWKQPYSLEVVSSVRFQTFLERSVLFQTFDAFRHIGIGFYDHNEDESMTWAMSVFRQGQDQFGNDIGDSGGGASAGRLTWLPYYGPRGGGLRYLHIGGAYFFGDPAGDRVRYLTIPEAYVGTFGSSAGAPVGTSGVVLPDVAFGTPPFVDTGFISTSTFANLGTELLLVEGPFSIQSEVQMSTVNQRGGPQLNFWGFYSYGSYFFTGESRPYDRKLGGYDRVVPLRPFLAEGECDRGPGAWEVAMRWSYIDLNDNNINGGQLNDVTTGLNWYLNGNAKIQFNYIHVLQRTFQSPTAITGIFGLRAQVDW